MTDAALDAFPIRSDADPARRALEGALYEIKRVIVGQDAMLERLLVALLAGGHVLLEGVPGLAKTLTVRTLADVLGGSFRRIQFTPDLVPADLVGTRIYRPDTGRFDTEWGPVFCNFLLADEINRAPAKVQSALPEAQVDRFLLKLLVDYPSLGEEAAVVGRSLAPVPELAERLTTADLERFAADAKRVFVDRDVIGYAVQLADATGNPGRYGAAELEPYIEYGASPRGPIGLIGAAQALALLRGRRHVVAADVRDLAPDVLRHRLVLSYDALSDGVSPDDLLDRLLAAVDAPEE